MASRIVVPAVVLLGCCGTVWAQKAPVVGGSYAMVKMDQERAKMAADERQKKLLEDAEHLLAMAQSLKTSVDATKKDELSVSVIKQANEIEKLAKSVKDRMRQ